MFGQLLVSIWKPIRVLIVFWQVVFFTQRFSEMMTKSTSSCETAVPNRQTVSESAVAAGHYSVSITSSGQTGHFAQPSLLHSGKLSVFSLTCFLVDLSISILKTSIFELPKSKIYRNWIGRPVFLMVKGSPAKSYVNGIIKHVGKEVVARHNVILAANEEDEI